VQVMFIFGDLVLNPVDMVRTQDLLDSELNPTKLSIVVASKIIEETVQVGKKDAAAFEDLHYPL